MNTSKQINIMILVVFVSIFATALYTLWDPNRASEAEDEQLETLVWRGAYLFSQNCATCHGDSGEGGSVSNRFRLAPVLDTLGDDYSGDEFDEQAYAEDYKQVYYTIVCGRVGKQMPTWGQSQGGPMNSEQIRQLTTLILRGGDEGWVQAKEFAFEGVPDFDVPGYDRNDLSLTEPLDETSTTLVLNRTTGAPPAPGETPPQIVNPNERLQIGGAPHEDGPTEIMNVIEVDTATNTVTVERGVGTTDGLAHEAGVQVFQPAVPPADPPIVEQSCGQVAGAAGPTPTAPPATANMTIIAEGIAWNTPFLTGLPNVPLTITVDNRDEEIHNWHLTLGPEPGGDEIPNGDEDETSTPLEEGPVIQTLDFGPLAPGAYYYVCDVHPAMEGVLSVIDEGAEGVPGEGSFDETPTGPTPVTGTGTPVP